MIDYEKGYLERTKILATLGPATDTLEILIQLINESVDAFRLNFSHGDYDYYEKLFGKIDKACEITNKPVAVLVDLQGPKIRIGNVNGTVTLKQGDNFEITTKETIGNNKRVSTSYKPLPDDVKIGEVILINDGLVKLEVTKIESDSVFCKVLEGGEISSKKGLNLPGTKLSIPSITEKDFRDLEFALKHRVDFVALSFVRKADDIHHLRSWMLERNFSKQIIAKIEKPEGVENFEEILKASDGIMVARGDLGVEMNTELVPIIQKKIIRRCNETGKLVITATQMLESMIHNAIPTRAEASDVANAVVDGTDVVMLSGETSVGKHPALTVRTMRHILETTELNTPKLYNTHYEIADNLESKIFENIAKAVVNVADEVKPKAIVVFTYAGRTAESLSKYRPKSPIFAFSNSFATLNFLNLRWGVEAFFLDDFSEEDEAIHKAAELLKAKGLAEAGDLLLFTAAAPLSEKERRTWMRFLIV
jgi:pyruvate kinase